MNPMDRKMIKRLIKTLEDASQDNLPNCRNGMEEARPMSVHMTLLTMKQSEPWGAVSWVIPCAFASKFEPDDESFG